MVNIKWATNDVEVIDAIRFTIGRIVKFYIVDTTTPCPLCNLDPITNTSTDSFCPTCSGVFWLYTYSGVSISGHVTWRYVDQFNWVTGGQLFDGDCLVQIKNTPENVTVLDATKWAVVDDKKMQVTKKVFRGVQPINRILISMIEQEKDG